MSWTERDEIKIWFEDIVAYLDLMGGFHDYRIGNIEYDGDRAEIMVEEVIPGKKISDGAGIIWNFEFEEIRNFSMSVDSVLGFYIDSIEKGDGLDEILFRLHSGIISIQAEKISLGIPRQE